MMQVTGISVDFPAGESFLDWLQRLCVALQLTYVIRGDQMHIYSASGSTFATIDLRWPSSFIDEDELS